MKPAEMVKEMMELIAKYGEVTEVLMYSNDNISVEAKDEKGNKYSLRFYITENEED